MIGKKERAKENFDYDSLWEEEYSEEVENKIKNLSKGFPKKGIKGKRLKLIRYVSKRKIKISYIKKNRKI